MATTAPEAAAGPAALLPTLASTLDSGAPAYARSQAVGLMYGIVKAAGPELAALVDRELLTAPRLQALHQLSEQASDPAAPVAAEILTILAQRSQPPTAEIRRISFGDLGAWQGSVRSGEQAWLEVGAEEVRPRSALTWRSACAGEIAVLQPAVVGARTFGLLLAAESVGAVDGEARLIFAADSGKPLLLRFGRTGRCAGNVATAISLEELHPDIPGEIAVGGRFSGTLEKESVTVTLVVRKGWLYRVATEQLEGVLDTRLRLLSPQGGVVVEDDDGGEELLASRFEWAAPADGRLLLEVSRVDADRGSFELIVEVVEGPGEEPQRLAGDRQSAPVLAPEGRLDGWLPSNETGYVGVEAQRGCLVELMAAENVGVELTAGEGQPPAIALPADSLSLLGAAANMSWGSKVSWVVTASGRLVFALTGSSPPCTAEPPWCAGMFSAQVSLQAAGGELRCATPSPAALASSAEAALGAPSPLVEALTWLVHRPRPNVPAFLRVAGVRMARLRGACVGDQECELRLYPAGGEAGEEARTVRAALSHVFETTGDYVLAVVSKQPEVGLWLERETTHDGLALGDCVLLGPHQTLDGDRNWASGMEQYVGKTTRITELAGRDLSGSWLTRVEVDGGRWSWRTRDMRRTECSTLTVR